MIRLSRKGWNNVLIFSTLFMIFLFNGLHHKLFDQAEDVTIKQNIIPPTELILTLDMPGISIERIGRGWRTVPEMQVSAEQLNQLVLNWKELEGLRLTPEQAKSWQAQNPDKVIVFWFAGATQGFVIQWYQQADKRVLKTPDAWFELSGKVLPPLFITD